MRVLSFFAVLAATLPTAGCEDVVIDGIIDVYLPYEHPVTSSLLLMQACRIWDQTGLLCGRVSYIRDADVEVRFNDGPCRSDLGSFSRRSRVLEVWPQCYIDPEGNFNPQYALQIMAHEFGHAAGVDHVPVFCDAERYAWERDSFDDDLMRRQHPDGHLVCGPAVMNSIPIHGPIHALTDMDLRAFDLRDHGYAIADLSDETCTLRQP